MVTDVPLSTQSRMCIDTVHTLGFIKLPVPLDLYVFTTQEFHETCHSVTFCFMSEVIFWY